MTLQKINYQATQKKSAPRFCVRKLVPDIVVNWPVVNCYKFWFLINFEAKSSTLDIFGVFMVPFCWTRMTTQHLFERGSAKVFHFKDTKICIGSDYLGVFCDSHQEGHPPNPLILGAPDRIQFQIWMKSSKGRHGTNFNPFDDIGNFHK